MSTGSSWRDRNKRERLQQRNILERVVARIHLFARLQRNRKLPDDIVELIVPLRELREERRGLRLEFGAPELPVLAQRLAQTRDECVAARERRQVCELRLDGIRAEIESARDLYFGSSGWSTPTAFKIFRASSPIPAMITSTPMFTRPAAAVYRSASWCAWLSFWVGSPVWRLEKEKKEALDEASRRGPRSVLSVRTELPSTESLSSHDGRKSSSSTPRSTDR
eukprot:3475344-Prymnesium_polylepis.1